MLHRDLVKVLQVRRENLVFVSGGTDCRDWASVRHDLINLDLTEATIGEVVRVVARQHCLVHGWETRLAGPILGLFLSLLADVRVVCDLFIVVNEFHRLRVIKVLEINTALGGLDFHVLPVRRVKGSALAALCCSLGTSLARHTLRCDVARGVAT